MHLKTLADKNTVSQISESNETDLRDDENLRAHGTLFLGLEAAKLRYCIESLFPVRDWEGGGVCQIDKMCNPCTRLLVSQANSKSKKKGKNFTKWTYILLPKYMLLLCALVRNGFGL